MGVDPLEPPLPALPRPASRAAAVGARTPRRTGFARAAPRTTFAAAATPPLFVTSAASAGAGLVRDDRSATPAYRRGAASHLILSAVHHTICRATRAVVVRAVVVRAAFVRRRSAARDREHKDPAQNAFASRVMSML